MGATLAILNHHANIVAPASNTPAGIKIFNRQMDATVVPDGDDVAITQVFALATSTMRRVLPRDEHQPPLQDAHHLIPSSPLVCMLTDVPMLTKLTPPSLSRLARPSVTADMRAAMEQLPHLLTIGPAHCWVIGQPTPILLRVKVEKKTLAARMLPPLAARIHPHRYRS